MREATRAGRSPAEAWERERPESALGSSLLGARLIAAARAAAAMHLAARTVATGAPDSARVEGNEEVGA